MSNNSSGSNAGIGFASLLTIAFIVLKLCDVIDWSWWWVLSPLWISFAAVIGIIVIAMIVAGGVYLIQDYRRKRR